MLLKSPLACSKDLLWMWEDIIENWLVWRLLYFCSEVTLSWNVGENLRRQYCTTQALNILSN